MPSMNVSLPEGLAAFVEREIAKGDYSSQSEVVRDALRLLHREKAVEHEKQEVLRRAVLVGVEDWRQGRLDERAIDEVMRDIDEEAGA